MKAARTISDAGVAFIKQWEGLELESYQDIAGVWTIGYGHTETAAPNMQITEAEAEALLRRDLGWREEAINALVLVPLNQNEFDALVSFIFNVGAGAFRKSTARKRLNAGDRIGAAEALTWFNKATVGGVLREVTGLSRRRAEEKALFLTPLDTTDFDAAPDTGEVAQPGKTAESPLPDIAVSRSLTAPEGRPKRSPFDWLNNLLRRRDQK